MLKEIKYKIHLNPLVWLLSAILLRAINQSLMKQTALELNGSALVLLTMLPVLIVFILLARAYCWQKALEHYPLSFAYPFSGLTLVTLMAIGYFVYDEALSSQNVIGVLIILFGIYVISSENRIG